MDRLHGKQSVDNSKDTLMLQMELKSATSAEDFVMNNAGNLQTKNLADYLNELLAKYQIDICDVAKRGGFTGNYPYQIFGGKKTPSRDKLLQIAIGFPLDTEETQQLLRLAGYRELYVRNSRDAYILFALEKKYTIDETNELLYKNQKEILE